MIKSRLFLRLFFMMVIVVGLFSAAIYSFLAPLVKTATYDIELKASRVILDDVFEMASKIDLTLEEQKRSTQDLYRRHLKDVVSIATSYIDFAFSRAERGEISSDEARRLVFDGLRTFKYGNDDYIWVMDYHSVLLSHPDPQFQGHDASELRDSSGRSILPQIIEIARRDGEGFYTYPWQRLGKGPAIQKMSYFKDLRKWGFIVGTGVYVDDIDAELARRKADAIRDLRQALQHIRIARNGYVYIFDAADNMIIHPNPNIEGTQFGELKDPATGRRISQELKAGADRDAPVTYMWDKPSDPGHYVYKKISWVRHFNGFDWYIASSVYVDELQRSSTLLENQILAITVAVMLLATTLGYVVAGRLARPLNRLAETAALVRAGDLNAESGIQGDDEVGLLASAFDGMVRRLRTSIATLDTRVRDRTAALEEANLRLRDAMTAQHQARSALAEVEARQRLILDAIPASIAYLGCDERLRFVNRQWAALVRRDKDQVIGEPLQSVIGRRAYASISPHIERTLAGTETTFEYAFTGNTGRTIITKNTLIPQTAADGRTVGLFVLSLDVTDEKETERQLLEAQRLKAVGQLSGGLAHDFNNLLSIILGNLAAAREKYAAVEGLEEYLEPAQRASRRGAHITSRLLSFSRQQPLKPTVIEVSALVKETAVLLRRSLPSSISVEISDDDRQHWVFADVSQLENALVNLALNARDAMPDGGQLLVDVGTCQCQAQIPAFDEPVAPGQYVLIRVQDSGSGFSDEALARAFEPFFTTKDLGSGLGLSMVYGFVKQSRGYIRLESERGVGAVVTILLPAAEPAPPITEPTQAGSDVPDPGWVGQLALLAEDDHDVRQVIRQQLIDLGFAVIEAASGDEAAVMVEQIDDICLVISDIVMPGLSGIDLAKRVRALRPLVKVVLISGFSLDNGKAQGDFVVLRKPWEKQDLMNAIRQTADGATAV